MALNSSSFLYNLIKTGADAPLNLFQVDFHNVNIDVIELSGIDINSLNFRTTMFTPPSTTINTQSLPYIGTTIDILSPGSNIERTIRFQIRADADYRILYFLRYMLNVQEDGNTKESTTTGEIRVFDVKVTAYGYEGQDKSLVEKYYWDFKDCRISSITPLTLNYEGGQGNYQVTLVYRSYTESLAVANYS